MREVIVFKGQALVRLERVSVTIFLPVNRPLAANKSKKTTGYFAANTTGVSTNRVAVLRPSCLPITSAIGGEY